jgi:ABC-type transport system substrate-binding protein
LKEIKSQAPEMNCEIASWNTSRTAIVNRAVPPFDNPELRRAIMLALDRQAFIDIIGEGQGEIGATMQPPPNGGAAGAATAPLRHPSRPDRHRGRLQGRSGTRPASSR